MSIPPADEAIMTGPLKPLIQKESTHGVVIME